MDLSRLNVDRNSSYTLSLFWGGGLLRKNPGFLEYLNSGFLPIPESKYLLEKKSLPLSHTTTQELSWESLKAPRSRLNRTSFSKPSMRLHLPLRKFIAANLEHQQFLGHSSSSYTCVPHQFLPLETSQFPWQGRRECVVLVPAPYCTSPRCLPPLPCHGPTTTVSLVTSAITFYHRVEVQL